MTSLDKSLLPFILAILLPGQIVPPRSRWWPWMNLDKVGLADAKKVQFVWTHSESGNLTGRSSYDFSGGDPCSVDDNNGPRCRENRECYYNCADRTCNHKSFREHIFCSDCSQFCHDICGCKTSHSACEYDIIGGNCRPSKGSNGHLNPCHCSQFENWECGRPNTIYAVGAQLCMNLIERGTCTQDDTILGVNLGSPIRVTNAQGVYFQFHFEVDPIDPYHTLKIEQLSGIKAPDPEENVLYNAVITGKTETRGKDRCVSYAVSLCSDGWYQLSVNLIDHQSERPGERLFNIKFNDILILPEIDVFRIAGGKNKPTSVHVNFQVLNEGHLLRISGHIDSRIGPGGKVLLSFCYGECDVDNQNYIAAGFSIVKLLTQEQAEVAGNCGHHGSDQCQCTKESCQQHVSRKTCVPYKVCSENRGQCGPNMKDNECKRAGAWYLDGGALCINWEEKGNCNVDGTLLGVKMTLEPGKSITDSRGVKHVHEALYSDPENTRQIRPIEQQLADCKWNWPSVPAKDVKLYKTIIHGKINGRGCLSYLLPRLNVTGHYELSMKFLENILKPDSKFQRRFVIKLGDLILINELDVRQRVGYCQPMEVIVLIEITDNGKSITVQGYPPMANDAQHTGRLSFCYSSCPRNPDMASYIISAFYLAKLEEVEGQCNLIISGDNTCHSNGASVCNCRKQPGCETSLTHGACVPTKTCQERVLQCPGSWKSDQCLRSGAFYADGGILCNSQVNSGICGVEETILGVKTAMKPGNSIVDSRNVLYLHEKEYSDPGMTREVEVLDKQIKACDWKWPQIPAQDKPLYQTKVNGKRGKNGCLSYTLPILSVSGRYELSLKLLETVFNDKVRRSFTIKLGDLVVISELDVYDNVGKCQPMEVIIPIEVSNLGKSIKVQGFPVMPNDAKHAGKLSFCYGTCYGDGHYIISSFYLAKLKDEDDGHVADQCPPFIPPKDDTCGQHGRNICACKNAGCETNLFKKTCLPPEESVDAIIRCPQVWLGDRCLRPYAYYGYGGILHINYANQGICDVVETVLGVKTAQDKGKTIVDSRHVLYTHESNYEDPHKTRNMSPIKNQLAACNWNSIPKQIKDLDLYKTQVYGNPNRRNTSGCLAYKIPKFKNSGKYELSLKFLENYYSTNKSKRSFIIKLGELVILSELDVFKYSGGKCKPMEVIIPFDITNNGQTIVVLGFPPMPNDENHCGKLQFCYGTCYKDKENPGLGDYIINAFYFAMLGKDYSPCQDVVEVDDHCEQYSAYSKPVCPCRKAGCDYSVTTNKCVFPQKCKERFGQCGSWKRGRCLRKGVYYADGGVLCENTENAGKCDIKEVIIATKATLPSGQSVVDSRGIKYTHEKNYIDPLNTRMVQPTSWHNAGCPKFDSISHPDKILYKSLIYGKTAQRGKGGCLSYRIPGLNNSREYELSLKFFENYLKDTKRGRSFTVKLNDVVLVEELDVFRYVGSCNPMEIIVPFYLEYPHGKKEMYLTVQGHQPFVYELDKLFLTFCYGKCHETPGIGDYIMNAFYIAGL